MDANQNANGPDRSPEHARESGIEHQPKPPLTSRLRRLWGKMFVNPITFATVASVTRLVIKLALRFLPDQDD